MWPAQAALHCANCSLFSTLRAPASIFAIVRSLQPPSSHSAASFSIFVFCAVVSVRLAKVAEQASFDSLAAIPAQQALSLAQALPSARIIAVQTARARVFIRLA